MAKDPTTVTGAFDIVACLPTNSTPGALVSGPGEMWSAPHGSNVVEHGWMEDGGYLGGPYAVIYNGTTTGAVVPDHANIQDLADAAFTVDMMVKADDWGEGGFGTIIDKSDFAATGWLSQIQESIQLLYVYVFCAGTNALSTVDISGILVDGKWHRLTFQFNDAGDRKIYIWLDSEAVASYETQNAGIGAITSDVGEDLHLGSRPSGIRTFDGAIGWLDISKVLRYTNGVSFKDDRRPPTIDINTVLQFLMEEGSGNTLDNAEGTAALDATLSNGVWEPQWDIEGTPLIPSSVEYNGADTSLNCGSDAGLDDLAVGAAFEIDIWFRADGWGEIGYGCLLNKSDDWMSVGWGLFLYNSAGIEFSVYTDDAHMRSITTNGAAASLADSKWHHIKATYNDAGDRKGYVWIDGIECSYNITQTAAVGNAGVDAGEDFIIGNRKDGSKCFDGAIGRARVDDAIATTADFLPPARLNSPVIGGAVAQWNMTEGAGATVDNAEGTAARDGTLSNHIWRNTVDMAVDDPGERIYNWGYILGGRTDDLRDEDNFGLLDESDSSILEG